MGCQPFSPCQGRLSPPDHGPHITNPRTQRPGPARRIIVCDYNQLLQSVTGLLRMSGYAVFQAYDGLATQELCAQLPDIRLVVLNTYGTGTDLVDLIHGVRQVHPGMPVLHIGDTVPPSLPGDVPTLSEDFSADALLLAVAALTDGMDDEEKRPGTDVAFSGLG